MRSAVGFGFHGPSPGSLLTLVRDPADMMGPKVASLDHLWAAGVPMSPLVNSGVCHLLFLGSTLQTGFTIMPKLTFLIDFQLHLLSLVVRSESQGF